LAITSLRFMLVCVPEPVCHTTSGKWSSSLPSITSRGSRDRLGATLVEETKLAICLRRGELDDAERMHDLDRHAIPADAEILPGTFGLRAPIAVGGNLDRAEAVGLDARGTALA